MRYGLVCAIVLMAPSALADDPSGSPPRDGWTDHGQRYPGSPPYHRRKSWDFSDDAGFLRFEGFTMGLRVPSFTVNGDNANRRLVGVPAPGGSVRLYGGAVGLEFRTSMLIFKLFEVRYGSSVGSDPNDLQARANEAPVTVGRGDVNVVQLGLPTFIPEGIQMVVPKTAVKVRFDVLDWGVSHVWTTARLTDANGVLSTGGASRWGAYLRPSLAMCGSPGRWAGPLRSWGCAFVAPTVYDAIAGGWFTGLTVGVRAEL